MLDDSQGSRPSIAISTVMPALSSVVLRKPQRFGRVVHDQRVLAGLASAYPMSSVLSAP